MKMSKQRQPAARKDGLRVTLKPTHNSGESANDLRGIRRHKPTSIASVRTEFTDCTNISAASFSSCSWRTDYGQPLVHIEYEGARHLHPERLPSARSDRTVSMKLTELHDDNVDHLLMMAAMLKRLDLSRTQLFHFPEVLCERLTSIEKLILNNNELKVESFNSAFSKLLTLREISLLCNKIRCIPPSWQNLKHLARINLENNAVDNIKGIHSIKKLRSLVLNRNNLQNIPEEFYKLKRMEILYLGFNRISSIPCDVKNLTYLREVDISHNKIQQLPKDIFILPRLESLNASFNCLNRLPTINLKGRPKRRVSSIDLSNNLLIRFPEHLVQLVDNLDVSSNKIKIVPNSLLKKLEWRTTQEIDVCNNPLISPPLHICEAGLKSMLQYYHESKIESKSYQGVRVLFLGSSGAGKTSLIQTMIDHEARLTEKGETSIGVEINDHFIETNDDSEDSKPLNLSIWDFPGNKFYSETINLFLQLPSICLLVFDMSAYSTNMFQEHLGCWIDQLLVKNNSCTFALVGTHCDRLDSSRVDSVLKQAEDDIAGYLTTYINAIEREIQLIESRPQINPALSHLLKQFINLKKLHVYLHATSVAVSSKEVIGLKKLENVLTDMAMTISAFPRVMRVIPSLWVDAETFLEDKANDTPLISWDDFVQIVQSKFGLKNVAKTLAQYLNETGKVIWLDNNPNFADTVLLRPSLMFECSKILLRHDIEAYLHDATDRDEVARRFLKSSSPRIFERCQKELIEDGVLDPLLIKALWSNLISNQQIEKYLRYFCNNLEFGYIIGERLKDGNYKLSPDLPAKWKEENFETAVVEEDSSKTKKVEVEKNETKSYEIPRIIIPLYRKNTIEQTIDETWSKLRELNSTLSAVFKFPRGVPAPFFSRAVVRFHNVDEFQLHYEAHWKSGIQARSLVAPVVLRFTKNVHEDNMDMIKLETRFDADMIGKVRSEMNFFDHEYNEERQVEAMWHVLLPLINNLEVLLSQYQGIWFRRFMQCPKCHEVNFMGEWVTPKELQTLTHKVCQLCLTEISTIYLIQPSAKHQADDIIRMKRASQNKRNQEMNDTLNHDISSQLHQNT